MPEIDLGPVIGPQGPKGDTGPQGEQGPQGPQGPAGKFDMDAGLTFTEASARANINSGESLKTILGKIKKYFTDLKPHAFKAPANNFTTTDATTAAAAPTVKQLKEDVDELNSALLNQLSQYHFSSTETWKAFNFRLPSNVSEYGYIPFFIVVAATIYVINISGGSAGNELSPDAITTSKLLGDDIHFDAVNENGQLRIKMLAPQSGRFPVTIIPLRKGISIESTYTGLS